MYTSEQDLVDLMDWQDGFNDYKGADNFLTITFFGLTSGS